jgi:putative oxygen-independent coproporphyrinogen III oxidase
MVRDAANCTSRLSPIKEWKDSNRFMPASDSLESSCLLASRLGIYVQVPFCSSKCTFCNFSSAVAPSRVLRAYLTSLEQEIDLLPRLRPEQRVARDFLTLPADTLYLGGGTPTLLGREGLERLFRALKRWFRFIDEAEITIEMTPGSADHELLDMCRHLGINRLSVGAQSFDDRELQSVGRLHSATDTARQVRSARQAGFSNLSLDFIAGLPYQTEASWLCSLHSAIDLAPEHISVYLFEIDEKSRLGNEALRHGSRYHADAVPDEDFVAACYEQARELLACEGFVQYEISNFARPGFESEHNRKYWRLEPYLGLGAGAHSFDGVERWANETSPEAYGHKLDRGELPISEWRRLRTVEQLEEFFFLGLRQREGVDLEVAAERWGQPAVGNWQDRIAALVREGWLEEQGSRLRLAPSAYLVSNEVFQEFLG